MHVASNAACWPLGSREYVCCPLAACMHSLKLSLLHPLQETTKRGRCCRHRGAPRSKHCAPGKASGTPALRQPCKHARSACSNGRTQCKFEATVNPLGTTTSSTAHNACLTFSCNISGVQGLTRGSVHAMNDESTVPIIRRTHSAHAMHPVDGCAAVLIVSCFNVIVLPNWQEAECLFSAV
jgi:hypothetical protein